MEQRVQRDRPAAEVALLRLAAAARDARGPAAQQLGGEVAERADHERLDQLDLRLEVGPAGLDLVGLRVAVAGRPTFQDICHKGVPHPVEADLLEQLVEQLPGPAHERLALAVLLRAGRLADEHQVGVGVAHAEDRVRARLAQRAAPAVAHLVVEPDQVLAPLLWRAIAHGVQVRQAIGCFPARLGGIL
jgi:hypothetical protein